MAAYPQIFISRSSSAKPDAGIRVEVADDGTAKFRKDRAVTAFALTILHEWIDQTDLDALDAFIAANGYGPHTFSLRGINYSITLINDPEVVEHKGGLHMVRVEAIGVKV